MREEAFVKLLSEPGSSLADALLIEAKEFWVRAGCLDDFCIQFVRDAESSIIFGGWNRVVWSLARGFRVDEPYCSDHFIRANLNYLPR